MKSPANLPLLVTSIASALLLSASSTLAGTEITQTAPQSSLDNLTLSNLFSAGWNEPWAHRDDPEGAPDMALLRTQTNFLEREFRLDTYTEREVQSGTKKNTQFMSGLIAYSLNRRIMLEVVSGYEWINGRNGHHDLTGNQNAFVGRMQLIDVPGTSYALTIRATPPVSDLGNKQTDISFALAGWHDLTRFGLNRMALYYHIQEETYAGPGEVGAQRNDMTYDVTLAKTWTPRDFPLLGNFTTFVEGYGVTNLDGSEAGKTALTITPGVRLTLGRGNILMAGVDFPISSPNSYDALYRLTYILNF